MDKKNVMAEIYKNRFLIIVCIVLIAGTFIGSYSAEKIPEEMNRNIQMIFSEEPKAFAGIFMNRFVFQFIILFAIFYSGNNIFGAFSVPFFVFISGLFFGIERTINYRNFGADNIIHAIVLYFTATVYYLFFHLIMAENSMDSSIKLYGIIKNNNAEKTLYNAKKHIVKLLAFTLLFAIISMISAYIFILLEPVF